jgi:predicted Zn-dependent protease with MMP-like domain
VQAAAADPSNSAALSERAAALAALGKYEESRVAYSRALAITPDLPDALMGAADLYLNRLPPSRDFNELALAYARRGHQLARKEHDKDLAAQFAVLQATALNGLGRGREAIRMADEALAGKADHSIARYEKASALWELCRFAEAKKVFAQLIGDPEKNAAAHHYLGLIAEREGDPATAEKELALARDLDAEAFTPPVEVSEADFSQLVKRLVSELPADMRRDLEGVEISTQDLPDLDDLKANDPPLSPEILGLFRGVALDEQCPSPDEEPGPCRAIVFYRKNLARTVRDRPELEVQTRVTLVHEIGHLRGEDDTQLSARGLE